MPLELGVWRIDEKPVPIEASGIDQEKRLEEILAENLNIASPNWMLIGRQVMTAYGNPIDLLAMDRDGNLVVLELKRNKTPREVVAQLIDYASWVKDLRDDDIAVIFEDFQHRYGSGKSQSLDDAFRTHFGVKKLPDELNDSHSLVVVAAELDSSTERIVRYLSEEHSVPVNAVFFRVFKDGKSEYLTRAWFIDPTEVESGATAVSPKDPWNGEYYVCFGHSEHRDWEDAIQYGFVSAGGGNWYTHTLTLLEPGRRFWAYVPDHGFVGVGIVRGERTRYRDFAVETKKGPKPLSQVELRASSMKKDSKDVEKSEYLVSVEWIKTVPLAEAVQEKGFFRNQNTVCRPRSRSWQHTVDRLKQHFEIAA